jgi:hypothetical protein
MMRWIVPLVVAVALAIWGWSVEQSAESEAKKFCDNVEVGTLFAEIARIAKTAGEDRLRLIREDSIIVGFTGIPPFSRHACEIRRAEDRVATKRYVYLD